MRDFTYRPAYLPTEALERLIEDLEVRREGLTPNLKRGFTLLAKKDMVRLKNGEYRIPNFVTIEDRDAWWQWASRVLGREL